MWRDGWCECNASSQSMWVIEIRWTSGGVILVKDVEGWIRFRSSGARRLAVVLLVTAGALFCVGSPALANTPLPDGRAWEMVSPSDKNGADIAGIEGDNGGGVVQASSDGQAITYVSFGSFAEPQSALIGSQYVAGRRAGTGWLAQNISLKASSQTVHFGGLGIPYDAFSPDLSLGLVYGGSRGGSGASRPVESPPLAGAPEGYEDYYLNDLTDDSLQSLLTSAPNLPPGEFLMEFLGSNPSISDVVVRSSADLETHAPVAPETRNLYEWEKSTGKFRLVNVLPDGTPETAHLVTLGSSTGAQDRTISEDGSRVIWSGNGNLYTTEGLGSGPPKTLQADAPEGEGKYLTASSDGTKIFFADSYKLTEDSTASGGGYGDLYRFEPDAPESSGLTDLVVDHEDPGGAEVQGVLGASEDGSYVYFVANGVLAPGASRGNCRPGRSDPEETCNLYLWHEGEGMRFIAVLSSDDESNTNFNALGVPFDWAPRLGKRTARVSSDGTSILFMSERSLTGYNNTVSVGNSCGMDASKNLLPAQCQEVFLYEADPHRLTCVSCNPSGARPIGPSSIPGGTNFRLTRGQYQSRTLSEGVTGGRVFFDSADALVPQDTNGREDVYEYENGHVYLLSDGQEAGGSSFLDASVNGSDVFFITRSQLVDQDTDQLVDLYDARAPHAPGEAVGFPSPPPPTACEGEDCRPPGVTAPASASPASFLFSGLGNAVPLPSSRAIPKAKVKKPKSKKPKSKKRKVKVRRDRKAKAGKLSRSGDMAGGSRP